MIRKPRENKTRQKANYLRKKNCEPKAWRYISNRWAIRNWGDLN